MLSLTLSRCCCSVAAAGVIIVDVIVIVVIVVVAVVTVAIVAAAIVILDVIVVKMVGPGGNPPRITNPNHNPNPNPPFVHCTLYIASVDLKCDIKLCLETEYPFNLGLILSGCCCCSWCCHC